MSELPAFLIVDTETTGLDPETDHLIEVAAVLFDPVIGITIDHQAFLLHAEANAAESINRIPERAVQEWGLRSSEGDADPHPVLKTMMSRGQGARGGCVPVAHGAEFDRRWLPRLQGQWLCTYEDAIWPRVPGETGSLTAIALAYDVGIIRAHRAIEDCLTLAAVLSRVHEIEGGLRLWYERAMEPRQELIACVSYNDRQLAKDAGFRWDGDRKVWWKQVRQSVLVDFAGELPFDVRDGP